MNTKIKKIFITLTTTLTAILLVTTATYAIGTLTPSGIAGDATQYTLNDIYTKLTTGTATSTKTGSFSTPDTASASFRTLTEIYNAIPATLSLSNSTTTVPVGINLATTTLSVIDTDLIASNIATGTVIFGVTGTKQDGIVYPTEWSADHPSGYVTWQQAMDYCDTTLGEGWRLPTYIELVNAYLTGVTGFSSGTYWSSTDYSTTNAYYVDMGDGYAYDDLKISANDLARCTR